MGAGVGGTVAQSPRAHGWKTGREEVAPAVGYTGPGRISAERWVSGRPAGGCKDPEH